MESTVSKVLFQLPFRDSRERKKVFAYGDQDFQLPFRDSFIQYPDNATIKQVAFNSLFGIPSSLVLHIGAILTTFNSLFGIPGKEVGLAPTSPEAFNSLFGILLAHSIPSRFSRKTFNSLFGIPDV